MSLAVWATHFDQNSPEGVEHARTLRQAKGSAQRATRRAVTPEDHLKAATKHELTARLYEASAENHRNDPDAHLAPVFHKEYAERNQAHADMHRAQAEVHKVRAAIAAMNEDQPRDDQGRFAPK